MTHAGVLRQSLGIVSGFKKLVRPPEVVPFLPCEFNVAAARYIIVDRNDEQRRGVRRGKCPRSALEPIDKAGTLRYFMRNFPIGALVFAQEVHGVPGSGKFTLGIQRESGPLRIPPEEPAETGTLIVARRVISGN